MNRWIRTIAAALALMLVLCCGALAEEKNTDGLLATVNGVDVPIDEAYAEYEYYAMIYSLYGYSDEDIEQLKQNVADYYVNLELIYQQFDALGMTVDEAELSASAAEEYQSAIESYTTYVDGEDMTDEEILKAAEELLIEDGYGLEYFENYAYNEARLVAVLEHYTGDIEATEEDIKAYYDELVAADKELYENDPDYYEQMVSYGERVMYTPEGFRAVKHILVLLSEEDESRMYELEDELAEIETALAAEDADTAALNEQKAAVEKEMDEIYATIEPTAQEIMDKLAAGEDFLDLLEEYGEDPGMTYEPYMTDGYLVWADSQTWVIPFRDAAMELQQVGDISQPVRTSYGLHIIRYERDVESGRVAYEDVKAELESEIGDKLANDRYNELVNQWREESEIVMYMENFDAEEEAATETAE